MQEAFGTTILSTERGGCSISPDRRPRILRSTTSTPALMPRATSRSPTSAMTSSTAAGPHRERQGHQPLRRPRPTISPSRLPTGRGLHRLAHHLQFAAEPGLSVPGRSVGSVGAEISHARGRSCRPGCAGTRNTRWPFSRPSSCRCSTRPTGSNTPSWATPSGNVYRLEGSGRRATAASQYHDGMADQAAFGAARCRVYNVEGYIKYRKNVAATVTLNFEYAGRPRSTKPITIDHSWH
jgi:hypothetical protein